MHFILKDTISNRITGRVKFYLASVNVWGGRNGAKARLKKLTASASDVGAFTSLNKIDDVGAKLVARYMSLNTVLVKLNLRHNSIGAFGAKAISDELARHSALKELELQKNHIGDGGGKGYCQCTG